jgi:hypothetical protein
MRRFVLGASVCFALILLFATPGLACGDKVLALSRALKLRYVSAHSASILVYARDGSPSAAAMLDATLQSTLKKSSQVLKIVSDPAELVQVLDRGKYDLILADAGDAESLERQLQASTLRTVVVPVLSQGTKTEASTLAKHYHVVLNVPSKAASYFSVLDEAMEIKSRRDEIKVLAKK